MTDSISKPQGPADPSRRNFLSAVGATVASLQTAACIRKPREKILPYANRPEDLVPGEARYFATVWNVGGVVQGLVVKSADGRPIKVDGNPRHPLGGGSSPWAQASVLALYDPERSRAPAHDGAAVEPSQAIEFLNELPSELGDGSGLALLLPQTPSPTLNRLLDELLAKYPNTKLYAHDGAGNENARAGAAMVGVEGATWTPTGKPTVIAAFDADPMATDGDAPAFMRMFAKGRDPDASKRDANRLYVVEPHVSVTGSNADHRLAVKGAEVASVLAALADALRKAGLDLPSVSGSTSSEAQPFVKALAKDLMDRPRGRTLVMVGERQPAQVHGLAMLINGALGNLGSTLRFVKADRPATEGLQALSARVKTGKVKTLVILGGNPAYDAPRDLDVPRILEKVPTSIHLGPYADETAQMCTWHIPETHYLEGWGDLVAADGTLAIQQPLISPLYPSLSAIELVARLMGDGGAKGYDLVRATHSATMETGFEKAWQRWLHDGVVATAVPETMVPALNGDGFAWKAPAQAQGMELDFVRDTTVLDGRFANSPWLQELPDPITKLVWDNAALVSPTTAEKLGVENGDNIAVGHDGTTVTLPVWIQPGTADEVVVLPMGYGRTSGGKFAKSGFDVGPLRRMATPYVVGGASVSKAGGSYDLACVQPEAGMHGRHHIRDATRTDFTEEPNFVEKFEVIDPHHVDSLLWEEPNPKDGHQWAMTVDLNSCTGCGSCTIACQAENNIPWVGKKDCMNGREMHWIRVDRYFVEQGKNVEVKYQPMGCAQCETAPCENVCPVGATVHGPEGLNNMAYNRCIGTRYCANNCPYKVRRFNFFHYTVRNDADYGMGIAMARNPDVTVRYRGVMEKCTYCVQRINKAKIEAKVYRDGVVREGEITTACQDACPAEAITFGNMNDEDSRVAKNRHNPRNYAVAAELNIKPRTTYLAKLSNPNPGLAEG